MKLKQSLQFPFWLRISWSLQHFHIKALRLSELWDAVLLRRKLKETFNPLGCNVSGTPLKQGKDDEASTSVPTLWRLCGKRAAAWTVTAAICQGRRPRPSASARRVSGVYGAEGWAQILRRPEGRLKDVWRSDGEVFMDRFTQRPHSDQIQMFLDGRSWEPD